MSAPDASPSGASRRGASRKLRMACLVHGIGGRESGVRRLVLDQAAAWGMDPGVEVGLFVRCEAGTEDAWRNEPHVVAVQSSRFGIVGRLLVRELLSLQAARWRPDCIYLRHTTVSPSLLVLAAAVPTVVGGDLDDLDELRTLSPVRYWYARLVRHRLLRLARGIIVVTHEIARLPSIVRTGRPVAVFPNSINVSDYPQLPAPANATPHLVFIGAPHLPWAGVDKIARLAAAFPAWQFDLIGTDPTEIPDAPANLAIHGARSRADYLPLMARADVAIGPLALHRKGLSEASALKVAEYLAYGIPVILGCPEAAFPDGAPFLLQLPNTEDNVEAARADIERFVNESRGRRVPRGASAPIDTMAVEERRLATIRAMIA